MNINQHHGLRTQLMSKSYLMSTQQMSSRPNDMSAQQMSTQLISV